MSTYEMKANSGSLFSNAENKKTDKHPDYKGSCLVEGKKMNISAWINESKAGKQYMSLKFDEFKPKEAQQVEYTITATDNAEIPF